MPEHVSNQTILQAIAYAFGDGSKSVRQTISDGLQTLMDEVSCGRVSLWRFEVQSGGSGLRCFASKLSGQEAADDSTLLGQDQYREYFAALVKSGIFVSNDAMLDHDLVAMRGTYLQQHGIGALLDVPVAINGRAYGIVCCEALGGPHRWSPSQIRSARQTVARAGLMLATHPSIDLEAVHSVPIAAF